MRAVKIAHPAGLDNLRVVAMPDPGQPRTGEVRVRIGATSLNYHDYAVAIGALPAADGRIPMSDGAGTVEAVGPGVTTFAPGDKVVSCFFPKWQDGVPPHGDFSHVPGDGIDGYARDVVCCPSSWFTRAPKGYSDAEAATLPCAALTAWRALVVEGNLKAGETVLVLGTGGVAIFALQFAKAMGASVILTSSSDEKLARARALGADHTINYKANPNWGATVCELTNGRGVDHVLEIGGPGSLAQSIAASRVGGHIAMIGILSGISGEVPTLALMLRQVRLQGLIVGSRRHQEQMVAAIDRYAISPIIDRVFSMEEMGAAFRYQESAAHFGKICCVH